MFFMTAVMAVAALRMRVVLCAYQPGPTRPQHYQDYFDEEDEMKPSDGSLYNPSAGYEPYWEDGDWVFMQPEPGMQAHTPTPAPLVCNEECHFHYRHIKHVCGRQVNKLEYEGCDYGRLDWDGIWNWSWNTICYGDTLDVLDKSFKTFDTYCQFLHAQCTSSFHDKWVFVYPGRCEKQDDFLRPIYNKGNLLSRIPVYYTQMVKERERLGLPPITVT